MNQLNSIADIRVASVLSGLEEDRKIAAQTTKTLRVKIDKGHAWLCRFIPFPMGARQMPWARLGQHWINGKPCYCKQHTSPDFGGDPNYVCPICEVTDSMHSQAENDDDRDDFYQCQVRISFLMYCLVIAKEDDRGRQEVMTDDEILTPYEFNVPKTAFATFSAKLERSKARKGGDPNIGLLSMENGCDLWVARDKKNTYNFDLSDSGYGPIFEMDDAYEAKMLRIWRQLKQPTPKFHDDARLESIAGMLAERLFKDAADSLNPDNQRSRRRGRDTDGDEQPSTRGAGRSFGRSRQAEGEAEEAPARQAPARTAVRQAPPPPRQAPPPPRTAAPVRQAAPVRPSSRFAAAQAVLDEADGGQPPIDETDQIPGAEAPVDEALPNDTPVDAGDPQQEEAPQQEAPPAPAPRQRVAPRPAPPEDTGVDSAEPPVVRRQAGAAPRPVAPPPAVAATRRTAPAAVTAAAPRATARPTAPPPAAAGRGGQIEDDPEEVPEEQRDPAPPPSQTAPPAPRPAASAALQGRLGSRIAAMKQNQG